MTLGAQFLAQLTEILDDAVVDDASLAFAWGCALASVGSPCVAQRVWPMPEALERLLGKSGFEIFEFARRTAAREMAVFERRDAG